MLLSDKWYDHMKRLTTIILPAFASAYYALGGIWNLPETEKVVGTITVIITFLGAVLGISSKSYKNSDERFDGVVEVEEDPGGVKRVGFVVNGDPETLLQGKEEVTFKVQKKR